MSQSRIFRDRDKLSPRYIPPIISHREKQFEALRLTFNDVLELPSESNLRIIQIIGPPGVGKTSTVIRVGEEIELKAKKMNNSIKHSYINLKLQGGSKVILYRQLVQSIAPEIYSAGLSAEEMLRMLLQYLNDNNQYVLLSLDEIDYYIRSTKDTSILYDLTRLNEIDPTKHCNIIGVIFTGRSTDFHEKLEQAELSTLGRVPIEVSPYKTKEVVEILNTRVTEAFNPGTVSEEVLEYVADITTSPTINGDLRHALDLLLYSGNLAESQSEDKLTPDHVRRIHGETQPYMTEEEIVNLPEKQHFVALLAIVRTLKSGNQSYASMKDIRLNCKVICEEMKMKDVADLDHYVQDLSDRKIIYLESLKRISILGIDTKNLEKFIDKLLKRLEEGLNEFR